MQVRPKNTVIGLAASCRTPFVVAVLRAARSSACAPPT
jgi:N-acetylmuramic acid 6-phosphate (MurNAc-6-P) etherase